MVPGPCQPTYGGNFDECDCSADDPRVVFSGERWNSGEEDAQCTYEYYVEGNPAAPEVGSWVIFLKFGYKGELTVFNEGEIIDGETYEVSEYVIGPQYYRPEIILLKV